MARGMASMPMLAVCSKRFDFSVVAHDPAY
jgi:hypothetical protein